MGRRDLTALNFSWPVAIGSAGEFHGAWCMTESCLDLRYNAWLHCLK